MVGYGAESSIIHHLRHIDMPCLVLIILQLGKDRGSIKSGGWCGVGMARVGKTGTGVGRWQSHKS
jgi:hypothetical protein